MHIYLYLVGVLVFVTLVFIFIKSNRYLKTITLDLQLGGIIFGGLIAIYALIVAFVVVIVWQQYQVTGDRIESESSKLFNVFRSSFAYTDTATARKMRVEIKNYIKSVQEDEWPAVEHDSLSTK